MSLNRPRRIIAWMLGILLSATVAGFLQSDLLAFDWLPALLRSHKANIARQLQKEGTMAHWSFDEADVEESVYQETCITEGTRLVPGRYGKARQFTTAEQGFIRTFFPLNALGSRFTFTCWLKFAEPIPDQYVFNYLAVADGRLAVRMSNQEELLCPAAIPGRFFHFAMTADAEAGHMRLYIDGKLQAEQRLEPIAHRRTQVCFGQPKWGPHSSFALDEAALWSRALSEQEVKQLAGRDGAAIRRYALVSLVKLRVIEAALALSRAIHLAIDLFNPWLHEGRVFSAGLPCYSLVLSKADIRAFNKYHNSRIRDGLNGPNSTSTKRKVELAGRDEPCAAVMELLGEYPPDRHGFKRPRMTFTVETREGGGGSGRRKLLFRPPEGTRYLLEILAGELAVKCGYPVVAPELCAVRFNHTFEGVFLCRDLACDQKLSWVGAHEPWKTCLLRLPLSRQEIMDAFDRCAAGYRATLFADRKNPLSSREIARDIRLQREQLLNAMARKAERFEPSDESTVDRVLEYLGEDIFLGGNPTPSCILNNLDLSPAIIRGGRIEYRSLAPAVLDDKGRITPPESHPAPAELDVTVRSGGVAKSKRLKFVVMPERRKLPLLRVDSHAGIRRDDTARCSIEFIGEQGGSSGILGGHIRLRGNTALLKAKKKYYFIRLDEARDFGQIPRTRHLMLTSAYRDPSLMREKLAYDIFRAFSEPGKPRYAPHVRHVELVLNRESMGIYCISDRVDSDLLRFRSSPPGASDQPVLYKAVGKHAGFDLVSPDDYIQKVPDWKTGACLEPYKTLMKFLGQADKKAFKDNVERLIDVDNIIDFEILLLITNNMEGRDVNLFIARDGGPDSRFFLVPWDYDMTFRNDNIASNHLTRRLRTDLPGYIRRFKARWTQLRKDRLSEPELMRRIDDMEAILGEGAARNFERWPMEPGRTHKAEVQILRDWLKSRLARLDQAVAEMTE